MARKSSFGLDENQIISIIGLLIALVIFYFVFLSGSSSFDSPGTSSGTSSFDSSGTSSGSSSFDSSGSSSVLVNNYPDISLSITDQHALDTTDFAWDYSSFKVYDGSGVDTDSSDNHSGQYNVIVSIPYGGYLFIKTIYDDGTADEITYSYDYLDSSDKDFGDYGIVIKKILK